jgi:hypothetical protein
MKKRTARKIIASTFVVPYEDQTVSPSRHSFLVSSPYSDRLIKRAIRRLKYKARIASFGGCTRNKSIPLGL